MSEKRKKPELLMPGGSLEGLKTAVMYGADAVYIGGEALSLRANAKNFTFPEMREGIAFAHAHGAKVFVAANVFARNEDLRPALKYFLLCKNVEPDGLILSDPGLFSMAREVMPECEIHISTQANNTNFGTWLFWEKLGAKRVVAARELSLQELAEIRAQIPEGMEMEAFVHGAMCISYSGRCLISSFLTGRDANRGECTHPCRWNYALMEETRPGEYFPVEESEKGTTLYNSKDLCMIDHIPELAEAGLDSWKVEGRMKTALYVATVARAYRQAIDDYWEDPELYYRKLPWYQAEVRKCTTRPFCTGFYFGRPDADAHIYSGKAYEKGAVYLGTVEMDEKGQPFIRQKNKFFTGEELEVMKPDGRNLPVKVRGIWDEEGNAMDSCPHPEQILRVDLGISLEEYDILRKVE